MSESLWHSVRGRVRRWLAHWLRTEPFDVSDFRPRIRFGPESAVTSSPATWMAASELRSMHPSFGPRDREGGSLAARHLLDLGHRRIGYVRTATAEAGGDRARHAGYASELRSAGIEPSTPMWWEPGSGTIRVGRRPMPLRDALSVPAAPTAVFVWNDHGAIGLIEACEASGISVPRDLSVVGFDNIAVAALNRISLTTVAQPLDFQAEKAVAMLLDRLNGAVTGKPRHLSVPVELRARGSTGPPRRARARA